MAATRTLSVVITGDARDAQKAFRDVEGSTDSLQTKLQSVGTKMMSTGLKMTAGITAPLALLGKVAFDAASDLSESMNKVDVVFADSAANIQKWSEKAATAFGMSRQKALEAAGTFGNLFRALGVATPDAAKMSKELVKLSADLASFNNADPEEVLLALRSGLVGEAEPLRKFGVSLSEARVAAKAMQMGLADADGTLSDAAKTQARYAIILEDTALAQGDFARTSDGAANKQRILKAQFQDTAAELGQALIPIMQTLMGIVQKVAEWFGNLSPQMQKVVVIVGIAAAAIGPLVTVFGALATVIGAVSLPVLAIGAAIAALVAAAVLLYLKWDEVWSWMRDHPAIAAILILLTSVITVPIIALVGFFKLMEGKWDEVWSAMQTALGIAWGVIQPILAAMDAAVYGIAAVVKWLGENAGTAFGYFTGAIQYMWSIVDGPLQFLLDRLNDIKSVAQTVANALSGLRNPFSNPFGGSGSIEDVQRALDGQRAAGGPTLAGRSYLIGEEGPEILTMGATSGFVTPNHAIGGGDITLIVQLDGETIARNTFKHGNRLARGGPVMVRAALA